MVTKLGGEGECRNPGSRFNEEERIQCTQKGVFRNGNRLDYDVAGGDHVQGIQ